ncbi:MULTISPECIES: hypothetical protein [Bradyrhizobium]|uniref:Uncharacterized protein n=1 Tax=Bradyrhizobium diversitatis TaxID=2755406 RepID=A0ABS0P0E8_9BRAD|nr:MULTISPECIES: hypothetical protein [Bradyrhizobium]MBH5386744.1 hypothetical protein [Bradyrhizobium diversitatis]UPJ68819.1 hypothetical protein IVB23_17075 [Bradyrhizobium sp. 191]
MTTSNMTASNQVRAEQSPAKPNDVRCPPMTHQNSGSHGHEMYPQQFVRLVGCHDASLDALRKLQDERLH